MDNGQQLFRLAEDRAQLAIAIANIRSTRKTRLTYLFIQFYINVKLYEQINKQEMETKSFFSSIRAASLWLILKMCVKRIIT